MRNVGANANVNSSRLAKRGALSKQGASYLGDWMVQEMDILGQVEVGGVHVKALVAILDPFEDLHWAQSLLHERGNFAVEEAVNQSDHETLYGFDQTI